MALLLARTKSLDTQATLETSLEWSKYRVYVENVIVYYPSNLYFWLQAWLYWWDWPNSIILAKILH